MIVKENGEKPISFITCEKKHKSCQNFKVMTVGTDIFIRTKLNGTSNITDSNIIIIDCSEYSLSYKFKTLLFMNYREYYCIIKKEQEEYFEKSFVNRFIKRFYIKRKILN